MWRKTRRTRHDKDELGGRWSSADAKMRPQARGNGISPPSSPSCILPLSNFLVELLISYTPGNVSL